MAEPHQTPPRQGYRVAAGASSHCAHGVGGDALREYLDWRPFEYFTCRFTPLANGPELLPPAVETYEFTPRVHANRRRRLHDPLARSGAGSV
jgi:hypothetical protein